MSKPEIDLPERLRAAGATDLERRLLDAAGRERPSHELSERMAQRLACPWSQAETPRPEASRRAPRPSRRPKYPTRSCLGCQAPWSRSACSWALSSPRILERGCCPLDSGGARAVDPSSTGGADRSSASVNPRTTIGRRLCGWQWGVTSARSSYAPSTHGRRGGTTGELANQIALVDAAAAARSPLAPHSARSRWCATTRASTRPARFGPRWPRSGLENARQNGAHRRKRGPWLNDSWLPTARARLPIASLAWHTSRNRR